MRALRMRAGETSRGRSGSASVSWPRPRGLAVGFLRLPARPPRPGRGAVWAAGPRVPVALPAPPPPRRMRMPRTLQPLCDLVAEFGDRTAILALQRDDREEWSFAKLASHARRLAA